MFYLPACEQLARNENNKFYAICLNWSSQYIRVIQNSGATKSLWRIYPNEMIKL